MIIFDYIYYRVARFFYKKDGADAVRAVCIITVIQALLLGAIIFSALRIMYGLAEVARYSQVSSKFGAIVCLLLLVYNSFRYKRQYWRLADRWRDKETLEQRKVRGWLVVFGILLPFFLLFWMGTSGYRA